MSDPIDPSQFRQPSTLRDGTPVLIRAARADDRERLADDHVAPCRYLAPRHGLECTGVRDVGPGQAMTRGRPAAVWRA
jgi:hypothetical protein